MVNKIVHFFFLAIYKFHCIDRYYWDIFTISGTFPFVEVNFHQEEQDFLNPTILIHFPWNVKKEPV
ncbi:hypothetical protein Pelsub_P2960 [Pelolinea submarina]|nr:hypothetical protein Pelsub_P2960 [Pelolinea submarina]